MKKTAAILLILYYSSSCVFAQTDSSKPKHTIVPYKKQDFLNPVPANHSTRNFGFFCRQELSLEKKLAIPVKLRLGSIDYCNYVEQKTAYKLPQQ